VWISPDQHKVVGGVLAAARKREGISQDDLALRLNKPQSFVSSFENGQRRVDLLEFLKICDAIGVGAENLFKQVKEAIKS